MSSKDSKDTPLNIVAGGWDLVSAATYIRDLQVRVHAKGWNLALGGGVLNNGWSMNDLDVLAVPRAVQLPSDVKWLLQAFRDVSVPDPLAFLRYREPTPFFIPNPNRTVYSFYGPANRGRVELIVFES